MFFYGNAFPLDFPAVFKAFPAESFQHKNVFPSGFIFLIIGYRLRKRCRKDRLKFLGQFPAQGDPSLSKGTR